MAKKKSKKSKARPKSATPRPRKRAASKPPSPVLSYAKHKEAARRRQKEIAASERDIAPDYPPIADLERRMSCRDSLKLFARTYNPDTFYLPFSSDHDDLVACLEDAVLHGAMHARAMQRGGGKSSLCQAALMWGFSYYPERFNRYAFLIGANETKASQNLNDIKDFLELEAYAADFPEIAYAFLRLERDPRRTLLFQGKPIRLAYQQDRLVLPTMPPPKNWPKSIPLRDGLVPSSGGIVVCCGLTSKSIRGAKVMQRGQTLRPGLVLLDDVQDDDVAISPTQVDRYRRIINRSVMGMAGPDKRISIVAPCTCIAPNDVACWLLDHRQNPHFRGKSSGVLKSMPKNMGAWDGYFEVYRACALSHDYEPANEYYRQHQAELDEGAVASWPESVRPPATTAIQAAMNEYGKDAAGFWSEQMNQPLAIFSGSTDLAKLSPDDIMARINQHERRLVPAWASTLTASIDCHDRLLYYVVCAWTQGFDGAIVDYGTFPEQGRLYFALREASPTISEVTKISTSEGALYKALELLAAAILGREWTQENGTPLRIQRCLVDAGWNDKVVFRFCRQSPHAAVLQPSKGYGITALKPPMSEWPQREGEKRGDNWIIRSQLNKGRLLLFDTYPWKNLIYERLLTPLGEPSNLTLFGSRPTDHRLLADHVTSEHRTKEDGRGRTVVTFSLEPGRDNHLFDALVGAAVAASIQGCSVLEPTSAPPRKPDAKTARANYERKRQEFEMRREAGQTAQPKTRAKKGPQRVAMLEEEIRKGKHATDTLRKQIEELQRKASKTG